MTYKGIFFILWLILLNALSAFNVTSQVQQAQAAARTDALAMLENPTASCRYGVNNLPSIPTDRWISTLGAGFYLNFTTNPRSNNVSPDTEFVPQVRMQQTMVGGVFEPTYVVTPTLTFTPGGLGDLVMNNPGRLWLVGNEPDVDNFVQDRMYPEVYARAYHEVSHFIKELDPTAYVANAGLSMATPGRLQYLDIVWDTYQELYGEPMPVDVWNFHLYILAEKDPNKDPAGNQYADGKIALGTDPALARLAPLGGVPVASECARDEVYCRAEHDSLTIFSEQVRAMRQWMKDHGEQNKPLILSEWSILYPFVDYDDPVNPTECFLMDEMGGCFTPQRVSVYMLRTLNYMLSAQDVDLGYPADDYRLVQQWKWYSVFTTPDSTGGSSNLLEADYEAFLPGDPAALTLVGEVYRESVATQRTTINLVGGTPIGSVSAANQPDGTAVAPITANFYNSGTTGITDPFSVTFYADEALTEIIGKVEITAGVVNGCAWGRNTERVTLLWEGLAPGTHRYWAKVDSGNDIDTEDREDDNLTFGTVTVYPKVSFIPLIRS